MKFVSLNLMTCAVDDGVTTLTSREFDWPQSTWGGMLLVTLTFAVVAWVIWLYRKETRQMSFGWRIWLTFLRLTVLGLLLLIALNPSDRTQKQSFRPSRVAVLFDTSLSMRHPSTSSTTQSQVSSIEKLSRADAISSVMTQTNLLNELRKHHEVSLYTFDVALAGPHQVYPVHSTSSPQNLQAAETTGSTNSTSAGPASVQSQQANNSAPSNPGSSKNDFGVDWIEMLRPRGLESRLGESLSELIRQTSGRSLSGIIVMTDGASNAGIDVASAHDRAVATKTRLVTVGTGSIEQPVNLTIAEVASPTDVAINDPYEIRVFIQGQGLIGKEVLVELSEQPDGETGEAIVVDKKMVTLAEDGTRVEAKFARSPTLAGQFRYVVKVSPTTTVAEFNIQDNSQTFR